MVYITPTKIGFRYLGNKNTKEVHDLNNETNNCEIDRILFSGHAVKFVPDTLDQARLDGYDNCNYCIGGSKQ